MIGLSLAVGCNAVDEKESLDFSLPGVSMNEGAVALQVAVVQVDNDQKEIMEEFWSRLDMMKLGLTDRQVADRNGLRYAVMSPQCPAVLDRLLEPRELDITGLTDIQKQMASQGLLESPSRLLHHQRIENDPGEEFEIPVSDYFTEKGWSIVDKNGTTESSSGKLVRAFFQMTTFPQGDGSVRMIVEPEIHHGRPQQRYDVSQRTFLFSESQIEERVEPLKFSIDLQPGEALIIASTDRTEIGVDEIQSPNVGDLFFTDTPGGQTQALPVQSGSQQSRLIESAFAELDKQFGASSDNQSGKQSADHSSAIEQTSEPQVKPLCRFLMVRLIHTHADDLFDRATSARPLTTINHQ